MNPLGHHHEFPVQNANFNREFKSPFSHWDLGHLTLGSSGVSFAGVGILPWPIPNVEILPKLDASTKPRFFFYWTMTAGVLPNLSLTADFGSAETRTTSPSTHSSGTMAPQPVTVADYRAQFRAQQGAEERVEGEASPAVCVGGKRLPQEPRERLMRDFQHINGIL